MHGVMVCVMTLDEWLIVIFSLYNCALKIKISARSILYSTRGYDDCNLRFGFSLKSKSVNIKTIDINEERWRYKSRQQHRHPMGRQRL